MIISYSHRFIFIHVPKTAGSSIDRALAPYAHATDDLWMNRLLAQVGIHVNYLAPHRSKLFRRHVTAGEVQRRLPEPIYGRFFKFAFVRNPWDRLVSYYHYILRQEGHHRHRRVRSLRSFEQYLDYEVRRDKTSQKQFVVAAAGNLLVDYVGRFETLAADFARVCLALGIPAVLGHVNRSSHHDYRSYYNDRTIELVARHFREDIDFFGYTFDGLRRRMAA